MQRGNSLGSEDPSYSLVTLLHAEMQCQETLAGGKIDGV